jgi:probable pyridine nucleotide-disulfide oxidoreductase
MNDPESYEAIVIGSGKGGKTLAVHLGKHGCKTALIERDPLMIAGGCINVACIPTKTFIASARLLHSIQHAANFGIRVDGAAVDWPAVRKRVQSVVTEMRALNLKNFTSFPSLDFILGTARFINREQVEVIQNDGSVRQLSSQRIFIDTGTRPAVPDLPRLQEVSFLTSETVQVLEALPEEMLVLGAGYIGL